MVALQIYAQEKKILCIIYEMTLVFWKQHFHKSIAGRKSMKYLFHSLCGEMNFCVRNFLEFWCYGFHSSHNPMF
jgi:hypothetical protein